MTVEEASKLRFVSGTENCFLREGEKYLSGENLKFENQMKNIKETGDNTFYFFEVIRSDPLLLKYNKDKLEKIR
jgi:hypothetical protein